VVRAGVGPIKGTFAMNVQFIELDRPKHAAVVARGQAPGSAVEMVSNMNLAEFDETHTMMEWSSDVTVSGMIQQVGSRLMQGAADKITQQVFSCIKAKLEAPVAI
jgi:carbon monoxide dehydrogenase subunit G